MYLLAKTFWVILKMLALYCQKYCSQVTYVATIKKDPCGGNIRACAVNIPKHLVHSVKKLITLLCSAGHVDSSSFLFYLVQLWKSCAT